jgi:hypothetical protein
MEFDMSHWRADASTKPVQARTQLTFTPEARGDGGELRSGDTFDLVYPDNSRTTGKVISRESLTVHAAIELDASGQFLITEGATTGMPWTVDVAAPVLTPQQPGAAGKGDVGIAITQGGVIAKTNDQSRTEAERGRSLVPLLNIGLIVLGGAAAIWYGRSKKRRRD